MSKNYSAEELHCHLLKMAKDFHQLCIDNNFRYYMLGGTMLGAVRHEGFIPWDDDMDFGMPREDYDKFIEFSQHILPEYYELRFYKNTANSPMHYAKLIDNRTTLIEAPYINYIEGLYIDIFPLDGAGSGSIQDYIRMKHIHFLQGLIINHCTTRKKRGIRKIIKKYAQLRNLDKMHNSIEILMTTKKMSDSTLIANYLGAWAEKEVMPKEYMGNPKLYKFEDTFFFGPEYPEGYLSSLYGDYMSLPPIEDQVFKHGYYYLNFNEPYKTFHIQ